MATFQADVPGVEFDLSSTELRARLADAEAVFAAVFFFEESDPAYIRISKSTVWEAIKGRRRDEITTARYHLATRILYIN